MARTSHRKGGASALPTIAGVGAQCAGGLAANDNRAGLSALNVESLGHHRTRLAVERMEDRAERFRPERTGEFVALLALFGYGGGRKWQRRALKALQGLEGAWGGTPGRDDDKAYQQARRILMTLATYNVGGPT